MSIKMLIVITVTSFDLSVMPWCPGPNQFVHNPLFLTVKIERMYPIGLTEGVNEPFSAGFIDDSVLKESIRHFPHVTSVWNVFHIELLLHAECFRGIVRLRYIGLLL